MSTLPPDYDSDPGRFLANADWPHEEVHPHVADRFAAAGLHRVLDVGGGHGNLAQLLPGRSIQCVLVDLSPAMLALAPRPAVRADGARLPFADGIADGVAALYTLYHYDDPLVPIAEARRVLRPGGLFAACSASRDSTPELATVLPGWGSATTFDGEDAPGIVAAVFGGPGDEVVAERWDAPMHTLSAPGHAAAFLRSQGMDSDAAQEAAAALELPMTLTMRGCLVYATKGEHAPAAKLASLSR